jgi:hypothetical protein
MGFSIFALKLKRRQSATDCYQYMIIGYARLIIKSLDPLHIQITSIKVASGSSS